MIQNGIGRVINSAFSFFILSVRGGPVRYHYEKPAIYLSMYGTTYLCSHPVYDRCTLFEINGKGIAVIQQRFDSETKKKDLVERD